MYVCVCVCVCAYTYSDKCSNNLSIILLNIYNFGASSF